MGVYLLLALAIGGEVAATVSLKLSENFTKLVPTIVVVVGYLGAFALMGRILAMGMPVGVMYAIWAAAGIALVAIIGAVFLGEQITWMMLGGLVLLIGGVTLLELGRVH
ncbi:MAG: QacE family quaternary ammonium compound efflux SMR transporter [Pseudonocardiaceae bacterium]|nr:QacE family quaternary ammonium compound efflux SMR transporter [Pseudonocardiaceae bacterium]